MEISKLTVLMVCSIFVCQVQGGRTGTGYDHWEFACVGQSMRLECPVGTIQLFDAWYGFNPYVEPKEQCAGTPPPKLCVQNRNASDILDTKCNGEYNCDVTVSDEFQDPCGSGFFKYLNVYYNCYGNVTRPTIPTLSLTTTHEPERIYKQTTPMSPTSEILEDGPTQKLTGTCQGCLVWKICVPVIVVVFLILVCVIVFIARRNNMKGKEKKEDRQEQQL